MFKKFLAISAFLGLAVLVWASLWLMLAVGMIVL